MVYLKTLTLDRSHHIGVPPLEINIMKLVNEHIGKINLGRTAVCWWQRPMVWTDNLFKLGSDFVLLCLQARATTNNKERRL